ncbi:MAG: hypothetical protein RR136_03235 [Clostridia bacterium]
MNKKIIIIISILILILIAIGLYFTYNYMQNKVFESNMSELFELIKADKYNESMKFINEKNLDVKKSESFILSYNQKIEGIKIKTLNEFISMTETDWKNLKKLNEFSSKLQIDENVQLYKYVKNILLMEEYKKYIPSINWKNSEEKIAYDTILRGFNQNTIIFVARFLENFNFDKFGKENIYISEWNDLIKSLSKSMYTIDKALKTYNNDLLEIEKQNSEKIISDILNVEMNIILKEEEITKKIKEL